MTIWQSVRRKNWHQFAGKRWRHVLMACNPAHLYASLSGSTESVSVSVSVSVTLSRIPVFVSAKLAKGLRFEWGCPRLSRKMGRGGEWNACSHGCLVLLMPKWWNCLRRKAIAPTLGFTFPFNFLDVQIFRIFHFICRLLRSKNLEF